MYCVCCSKRVNLLYDQEKEIDLIWSEKKAIENLLVADGVIQIIDSGYGSKHDGDQFVIAICDDCITEKLKDHTVLYYNNYMFEDFSIGEIEESKKGYTRRKNLDDLLDSE